MADGSQVLREYLISLGFRINTNEAKKFDGVLVGITKQTTAAGAAVAGLAEAAIAMAKSYASSMEKLYFSSRRSGSTVKQIQALEYAGEQVGISADTMRGAIEGMAKALRGNPGLTGLLKQLGVKTEGRTSAQEMVDLVEALRRMPFFQAKQFASMFGMDEDTFQMFAQNLDKIRELAAERSKMDEQFGVDADENAKAMNELVNITRMWKAEFVSFEGLIAKVILNPLRESRGAIHELLADWSKIINGKSAQQVNEDLAVGMGFTTRDKVEAHGSGGIGQAWDAFKRRMIDKVYGPGAADRRLGRSQYAANDYSAEEMAGLNADFKQGGSGGTATAGGGSQSTREMFEALEAQYGLPRGLLDSLWDQESKRGTTMKSPTGVLGHFQITGPMRKAYGVTDPNNLSQEAVAAAEIMADNLKLHHGDLAKALAQYNGGSAAGRDLALGSDETKAYVPSVLRKIDQYNTITIHATDPRAVNGAVKEALDTSNGNLVREMRTVTQ